MSGSVVDKLAIFCIIFTTFSTSEATIYGKFIQVNDMHYDYSYEDRAISCNTHIPREQRLPYGNYDCDAPLKLIQSSVHEINKHTIETDFIMWGGDIGTHTRNLTWMNETDVLMSVNITSYMMRQGIHPDVPIYPMLGNHDYWPKNQLPVRGGLYDALADIMCPIFKMDMDDTCKEFRKAGFYHKILDKRVMVMVVNSNLYSTSNKEVSETDPDPAGQFQWMSHRFEYAKQNGIKVHVFTHIPSGPHISGNLLLKTAYNTKINEILRENHDVIIGVYAAHVHTDSFKIIYKDGEPVVSMLMGPSVTPWRWVGGGVTSLPHNPSIRVLYYQPSGRMFLTDYEQRYLDLAKANADGKNITAQWKMEYKFSSYKDATDISPKTLQKLVDNFKDDPNEDFPKYFERYSVMIKHAPDRPPGLVYICSKECKNSHICYMTNMDIEPFRKCIEDFRKSTASLVQISYLMMIFSASILISNYM